MGRTGLAILAGIFLTSTARPCHAGDLYGLVIGVNDYAHVTPLHGAVNDARDISEALRALSARDVRLLLDGEATREAVFAHWRELAGLADEGDTLILHFAGHGGRQDAVLEVHEDKDNVFLLAGFDPDGPGITERIVDNEVGHLLAEEDEATVVLVADTCFAGDMLRSADERVEIAVRSPVMDIPATRDAVAERVRQLGEIDDSALGHVIWLYAQDANKLTPEITIDGRLRGALSHAFGRALRGEADGNSDGVLSVPELKRFVNRDVVRRSMRRQRPEVNAGSGELSIPLDGVTGGGGLHGPSLEVPELRIFHIGAAEDAGVAAYQRFSGTIEAKDARSADMVMDTTSTSAVTLIYKTGDVVARFPKAQDPDVTRESVQGAIDKWRLIEMFPQFDSPHDPELALGDGDRVYADGEIVEFLIRSPRHRHVVLFNLAHDGTVQLVAPVREGGDDLFSGLLHPGQRTRFSVRIEPPFGADNLVALTTPFERRDLHEAILAVNGQRGAYVLAEALSNILPATEFGMDSVAVFTVAKRDEP